METTELAAIDQKKLAELDAARNILKIIREKKY